MDEDKLDKIEENRLSEMLNSEGWLIAKAKLEEYIHTMDLVETLPNTSNEVVGEEAKVRARTIKTLRTWLADLEGIQEAKLQDIATETVIKEEYLRVYE